MPTDVLYGKTLRKSFARTPEIMDMPNLLEIQKSSYQWFLNTGLKEVFQDVDAVTPKSRNIRHARRRYHYRKSKLFRSSD